MSLTSGPTPVTSGSWVWASSHLSLALDGFPVLTHLSFVPIEGKSEPVSQLLDAALVGALQRQSPLPGQEASGAPGITSGEDAHHPFCSPDQAERGICKDLQAGSEVDDPLSTPAI